MPYSVTKAADGDVSFGSWNGELVTLQPTTSDYATGGYALISGVQAVNDSTKASSVNVDLYKINAVVPVGGQGGYVPVWNPTTQKLQVFRQTAATSALVELPANTDISGTAFLLLLLGL